MKANELLRRYYLSGVPYLIVMLIFQLIIKLNNMALFYVLIGFIWPYTFKAPGFINKIKNEKNKYTFLKLTLNICNYFYKLIGIDQKKELIFLFFKEVFPSICFILIMSSMINFRYFYFVFFGNIFYFTFLKINDIRSKKSTKV